MWKQPSANAELSVRCQWVIPLFHNPIIPQFHNHTTPLTRCVLPMMHFAPSFCRRYIRWASSTPTWSISSNKGNGAMFKVISRARCER